MEKLIRYARNIDKMLSVLRAILFTVAAALGAALLLGIIFAGSAIDFLGPLSFLPGILRIWPSYNYIMLGDARILLVSAAFVIAMTLFLVMYVVHILKRMTGEMKEGRPFSPGMPARIRKLAYAIFVYAVAVPALSAIPGLLITRLLDHWHQFGLEYDFLFNIDLTAVFAGFLVLLLSLVFEYGAKLQNQDDELL